MSKVALSVLAALALGVSASAAAQDSRWHRQVSDQLDRYSNVLNERGFRRSHEIRNGSLDDDESESFTLELDAGRSYAMIGVCDEDCTDIDLRLYDDAGREVDADIEMDDYPVVEVQPVRTAVYRVKVIMATCSTSPCFYGVGVFAK